ncbi:MAG: class I SAM-dependent methyltransferase [Hormoscilla sp. GM102CHS1]|nr:class I SAM-dependent methyltransferase [Hormoscilla sp. GM102CHS1]
MDNNQEIRDRIRQQFDSSPYGNVPLDLSPQKNAALLYFHNLVTPYHLRNQKIINPEGKVILDAGCGSGYKSLVLAAANPGAKIVGIDLSEESVKLARQRLLYQGFADAEFYAMPLEELPSLGMEFDYINCDETLYLLPDIVVGLQAMKSVLKPDGIIRANLHSSLQRQSFFRAQEFFTMLGLMDGALHKQGVELVRETMKNVKDHTYLKIKTWHQNYETNDEYVLANQLLQGDKGYNISEMFAALRMADLEFVSMVQWRKWDLLALFKDVDELLVSVAMALGEMSAEEQLHAHELLQSSQRLLDFWCGHSDEGQSFVPVEEWTESDWRQARVHLHPQLRTAELKQELMAHVREPAVALMDAELKQGIAYVTQYKGLNINQHLPIAQQPVVLLDSAVAAWILPLLDGGLPMISLVERWLQMRPINSVTLESSTEPEAFAAVKQMLSSLVQLGYILLER